MNNVVTFPVTTFCRFVYDGDGFDSNYPPCHITSQHKYTILMGDFYPIRQKIVQELDLLINIELIIPRDSFLP